MKREAANETHVKAEAKPRGYLVEIGLGVAWLIGAAAVLQIIERLLDRALLVVAVAGAVVVDVTSSWAGVRWDEDARGDLRSSAVKLGRGAALGVLVVALALAGSVALGAGSVALGRPSPTLVIAVIRAVAIGVRDELLFRAIPLTAAARAGVPVAHARVFAALTSAAAVALVPGVTLAAMALSASVGLLAAALFERDRGAWGAVGMHAALVLTAGPLFRGGALDVTWTRGDLTLGVKSAGLPTWLAVGIALALAVCLLRSRSFRHSASPRGEAPDDPAPPDAPAV
jgi:hypothetical protein